MPTVLITGASRGIGREFARQYEAGGWRVIATCRDPSKFDLAGEVHRLDVTDMDSLAALHKALNGEGIDVLINNAGIYGPRGSALGAIDYDAWEKVLRTNVLGAMRVAEAFAVQVARSQLKRMVFLSSRMGSIGDNTGGGEYIYRSSKAALNMAVKSLSIDLYNKGVICLLFHPGWVRTDMGGTGAPLGIEESVASMAATIDALTMDRSGAFLDREGQPMPW